MFRPMSVAVLVFSAAIVGAPGFSAGQANAAREPTKEQALANLRAMCAALEAGNLDKAIVFIATPPGGGVAEVKQIAKRMLEAQEISKDGIDVIERDGKWGKLAEVKPKKGAEWAAKFNVPLAQCYAIEHPDGAEAAFHFDGKVLKIIRCDDIGKLRK